MPKPSAPGAGRALRQATAERDAIAELLPDGPLGPRGARAGGPGGACFLVSAEYLCSGVVYQHELMTEWSDSEASIGGGHGSGTRRGGRVLSLIHSNNPSQRRARCCGDSGSGR